MEIKKEYQDKKLTLEVIGRLDTMTAPELESLLPEIEKTEEVVLDFNKLEYISSAGLRVLLKISKIMKDKKFSIHNANDEIMEIFDITGFKDILTID